MPDKSLIDIILTNNSRSFHETQGFVTGLRDFHKLVVILLRSCHKKLPPKNVLYRNVKRFKKTTFLRDLDSSLIQGELYNNCQEPYHKLTQIFSEVLDYHAPVKRKVVRGNQSPFMTKDLSSGNNDKVERKKPGCGCPSRENFLPFEKSKNKCKYINKKTKKTISRKLQNMV